MTTLLHIQEQPRPPLSQQVRLSADGVHHRLARSGLTLGVVALAVAFLMNVLVEEAMTRSVRAGVEGLWRSETAAAQIVTILEAPLTADQLQQRLTELSDGQLDVIRPALGLDTAAARRLRDDCIAAAAFAEWLDRLQPVERRMLWGDVPPEHAMTLLARPEERAGIVERARQIPIRLPDGLIEFASRETAWRESVRVAAESFNRSTAALHAGDENLSEWLAGQTADASGVRSVQHRLNKAGLSLSNEWAAALITAAQARGVERRVLEALAQPELLAQWSGGGGLIVDQDSALAGLAKEPDHSQWLAGELSAAGNAVDAKSIQAAAQRVLRQRELHGLRSDLAAAAGSGSAISGKTFWLIVVSLLLCAAGITNAMLVSVIERFRQIATMKCLGAIDTLVATLFLIEAGFLGLAGGIAGTLIGAVIGAARMRAQYGHWATAFFPWEGVLFAAGISIGVGLLLVAVSATYPALAAAKMPPIQAMRVE